MTDVGNFFVNYVANSLWQLPLFALAAVLLQRLLRRVGPLAQHRIWVSTLVAAIVIPALSASTEIMRWTQAATGATSYSIKMGGDPGSALMTGGSVHLPSVFFEIALAGYLVATLCGTVRLLNALRRTRLFQRAGKAIANDVPAEPLVKNFCSDEVAVLSSEIITTPVTLGWRKPVLLVPVDFHRWHPEDAAAAIAHECAHINRHDFFWNLLYQTIAVPIAYHPVTWFMKSRIAATRETVCDTIAAERAATPTSYARALLRIAGAVSIRPATAPAIGMFDGNVLEKRIMELMESKQLRSKGLKASLIVVAVAVFAAVCVGANAFSTNVEDKAKASEAVQPNESLPEGCYKVGGDVIAPKLINEVEPVFPPKAKEEKRTGRCRLELIVDEKGMPRDVKVIKSLAPDFDENAIRAVQEWRFSPATLKGKPVAVRITTEINFQLY